MIKIAFTGPESSGKTTLSQWTADQYNGQYVEEYAREFLEQKGSNYQQSDLDIMAIEQQKRWEKNLYHPILVCDTEMIVFKIWSKWKYNSTSKVIEDLLANQSFDYYFLCYPDIPWEEDPLRENPEQRWELFQLYQYELFKMGVPFSVLKGSFEEKQQMIQQIMETLQKEKLNIL